MELTGLQNPMVKAAAELKQKKYRQQQGLFLAEGLRTVEEAVRYGAVQSIFYTAIEDERQGAEKNCRYRNAAGNYCCV